MDDNVQRVTVGKVSLSISKDLIGPLWYSSEFSDTERSFTFKPVCRPTPYVISTVVSDN